MNKGYDFDLNDVCVYKKLSTTLKREGVNMQYFVDCVCAMGIIWSKNKDKLSPIQEFDYQVKSGKKYRIYVLSPKRVSQKFDKDKHFLSVGLKEDFPSYILGFGRMVELENGLA